jgi:ribosomal protein S12 methylthiotransferase accessory factor YcaO
MAAFPGLFARQARAKAYFEAVERFSLVAWWEGHLPALQAPTEWPGVQAAVIWAADGEVVVLLHKKTTDGAYAYGHGAGPDFSAACRSAVVELARHEYVIRSYRLAKACGCAVIDEPNDRLERRSVFFASEEGHEQFLWRLHTKASGGRVVRRLAFDGPIKGPWSRYADVWRVVFHPVSKRFVSDDEHYFLW